MRKMCVTAATVVMILATMGASSEGCSTKQDPNPRISIENPKKGKSKGSKTKKTNKPKPVITDYCKRKPSACTTKKRKP